jgi:hypothetical protein
MQLYAAYSSASAFSNAMYLAGGGVAGLPRGGSGNSLDGSVPIRPIATSGSFSNALTAATAHGFSAEAATPAAAPAAAADSGDAAAEAAAPPPAAAQPRVASPLSRAAEGADVSGAAAPAHPPVNPAAGSHLFFPVGGLPMPPMMPMPHMMPMVGPMGVFYGPGFANMPMHLAAHGMHPGLHAGMPMMPWPAHPPQPPQPR